MFIILFAVMCIINAALSFILIATVDEVRDQNTRIAQLVKVLAKHDDEIGGLVNDFNGMNNKLEKDYTNHMKDMNMLNKRIIALSREGEKA